jgi:hypothetical protein
MPGWYLRLSRGANPLRRQVLQKNLSRPMRHGSETMRLPRDMYGPHDDEQLWRLREELYCGPEVREWKLPKSVSVGAEVVRYGGYLHRHHHDLELRRLWEDGEFVGSCHFAMTDAMGCSVPQGRSASAEAVRPLAQRARLFAGLAAWIRVAMRRTAGVVPRLAQRGRVASVAPAKTSVPLVKSYAVVHPEHAKISPPILRTAETVERR